MEYIPLLLMFLLLVNMDSLYLPIHLLVLLFFHHYLHGKMHLLFYHHIFITFPFVSFTAVYYFVPICFLCSFCPFCKICLLFCNPCLAALKTVTYICFFTMWFCILSFYIMCMILRQQLFEPLRLLVHNSRWHFC